VPKLIAGEEAERDGHGDQGRHHQRPGSGLHVAWHPSTGEGMQRVLLLLLKCVMG